MISEKSGLKTAKGLEIDGGGTVQYYECTKCHWNVHLKIVTVVNDTYIFTTKEKIMKGTDSLIRCSRENNNNLALLLLKSSTCFPLRNIFIREVRFGYTKRKIHFRLSIDKDAKMNVHCGKQW